jgi:regulator of replication initiation timing
MSSELDSLRQRIIELEAENAEVKAKYIKVMDENAEVKAENAKLRCALEEHEARFTRLEQRDKEKTNLIAKMDDDIKEIKQSSANASFVENPNNVVRLGKLEKMANPLNTSDSTFNSNVCKPIRTETKSLEDKETDDFLDEVHKKRVSDEIRQRNKEKKIQRESTVPSDLSCVTETSLRNHDENTKTGNIVHDQEKISLEVSVQKMPERLNEDVSQRESDSGLVTEIVRDLLQGFLVDDFQREFINTEFIDREHSNSSPVTEELARLFYIVRKNSIKTK